MSKRRTKHQSSNENAKDPETPATESGDAPADAGVGEETGAPVLVVTDEDWFLDYLQGIY